MRKIALAFIALIGGFLATAAGERYLSEYAPEWFWRMAYGLVVAGGVSYALFNDPCYGYLKEFREHVALSTIIVATSVGIMAATIWVFGIIGFPSSKDYMDFRVRGWIKSLKMPWTVTPTRVDPGVYFGFYIDHADRLGVGASRSKNREDDDHVTFAGALDFVGWRRLIFDKLSRAQRDKLFRELAIEADKQKITYNIDEKRPCVSVTKSVKLNGTLTASLFMEKLDDVHTELHLLAWTIDKFLSEVAVELIPTEPVAKFPRLWGTFDGCLDNEGQNGVTNIFPLLSITNNGPPTLVDIGTATIKSGNKTFSGLGSIIYEEGTQHVFQTGVEKISRSEMIVEKLGQKEIQTGGRITGWLMYELPGISISELRANGYEISLFLRDASGNEFPVSSPSANQMGGKPAYIPGFNNPVLKHAGEPPVPRPTPPSPTPDKGASPP